MRLRSDPRAGSGATQDIVAPADVKPVKHKRVDNIRYISERLGEHAQTGLEISPSLNPILRSTAHRRVEYLEVNTTDELREMAAASGQDPAGVPEIHHQLDFSRSLASCVGGRRYDFAVSSHVIEHVPDLVGHLREVRDVLEDSGVYALIAPDKDLCFDIFKPESSLGQVIEASIEGRRTAPVAAMIDEYWYGVRKNGAGAWRRGEDEAGWEAKYPNSHNLIRRAIAHPEEARNWHGHVWRFNAAGFARIIAGLGELDLLPFTLEEVVPTSQIEFIAIFRC